MTKTDAYVAALTVIQAGAAEDAERAIITEAVTDKAILSCLVGWAARGHTWGLLELAAETAFQADVHTPVHGLIALCRLFDDDPLHAELHCLIGHTNPRDSLSQVLWHSLVVGVEVDVIRERFALLTPRRCLGSGDAQEGTVSVWCVACSGYLRIDVPEADAACLAATHSERNCHVVEIHR